MFTFQFFRNPANDSLHLRLIYNRKKAEMNTGLFATEEAFADAQSGNPRKENIGLSRTMSSITTILRRMQCDCRDGVIVETDVKKLRDKARELVVPGYQVQKMYDQSKTDESKLFMRYYMKCMLAVANDGYRLLRKHTYDKVVAYCKSEGLDSSELTFEDITLQWLNAFNEWQIRQGLAQNTRNMHFRNIRTVINRAIDEELTEKYPFRRFKIRPEATRKRNLSVEDLRRLFDYPCEEYQRFYRDIFKLSFLLIGINPTDLYNLECVEYGRIEYRRAKTHKLYSIKVEPEAMEIIERWRGTKKLLCIADRWKSPRDFIHNTNISLKKIGRYERKGRGGRKEIISEWPAISMYYARHSWATIAYNNCRISKDIISQALGHSTGVSITEVYLDKDQELVDEANRKVIDFVLYGKE